MSWMNFSNAEEQSTSDLIPHKTPVKVRMKIRPGAYTDSIPSASQPYTDPNGYPTRSDNTGAIYLDAEFTIMGGKFNKRKVWSLIGLYSPKGPKWEQMGRSFIRAALESARGIRPDDASELAMKARVINGFQDLDGLEFAALVEVQKAEAGSGYDDKNQIQTVIPVGHKDYAALMSGAEPAPVTAPAAPAAPAANGSGLPAWAQ